MKPAPPPKVPGNTEAERFDNALGTIFSVPKGAVLKREAKEKQTKLRKKLTKST